MASPKRDRQRAKRSKRAAQEQTRAKDRRRASLQRLTVYGVTAAIGVIVIVVIFRGDDNGSGEGSPTVPTDTITTAAPRNPTPGSDPDDSADPETEETVDPDPSAPDTSAPDPSASETSGFAYGNGPCPAADGSSGRVLDFDEAPRLCIDPARDYTAVFDTSEGEIRFALDTATTPGTVNNFVALARWGYYDGTLLFRIDPSIDIIQGGSPHTNTGSDPGPGYTIPDEPGFDMDADSGGIVGPYRYQPGQIAMARTAAPNSASAQFFFTTGPATANLDSQGTYVVFGNTDEAGLETMAAIMGLHVDSETVLGGAPSREVAVHSVTIEETSI